MARARAMKTASVSVVSEAWCYSVVEGFLRTGAAKIEVLRPISRWPVHTQDTLAVRWQHGTWENAFLHM